MGVLAAEAVRQIASYLKNEATNQANTIRVPLTQPLSLPPLQTYTYMPVLNQIVKRTVQETAAEDSTETGDGPATPSAKKPGNGKFGSVQTPLAPTPKGVPTTKAVEDGDDGEDGEGDDDLWDDEKVEDELAALEEMQKSVGKKRKRAVSKQTAKPKAKAAQ
jgi:hypothetical protein